eukprot:CAMPEP_0206228062 /NCGR_PEP_ID=MMETSP0047_2-20121206/8965_1 /ASSEMBLY_ACC=CAM_ASM_000192 /TAXON_ID=195065 /ORGANISM="Chroomonas mesostigmatica_cf, Strain CCMP1168" /LENGTH=39 /DNA_ID= /DNA_START= /DNA_END= /DNA_ORIENTATION=
MGGERLLKVQDKQGKTALDVARDKGHVDVAEMLQGAMAR